MGATMDLALSLRDEMVAAIPQLRAYARKLCKSDRADDLVQETFARALSNIDQFEPGTRLVPWLITILKYHFFSECRKHRRELEDVDGIHAQRQPCKPDQLPHLDALELSSALHRLPGEQREAVLLVGYSGLSYEEAARVCGCPIGTLRSRVHRARAALATLMAIDDWDDFLQDGIFQSVAIQSHGWHLGAR